VDPRVSILSALIQINGSNKNGSDRANGYALRFSNEKFIYEVGIMKAILEHVKGFLKQTDNRSLSFDKFPICLDSTVAPIKNNIK
jgi:hypothetical protein